MDQKLENKTAIVTGASGGQGAAEARLLAKSGARVILADIQDELGEAVAQSIRDDGGDALYKHLDVSELSNWQHVVQGIADEFGALHILVNNAGIALRTGRIANTSLEDWNRVMAVNLTGPFLGIQTAAPLIRDSGGGAIVNTGSIGRHDRALRDRLQHKQMGHSRHYKKRGHGIAKLGYSGQYNRARPGDNTSGRRFRRLHRCSGRSDPHAAWRTARRNSRSGAVSGE